MISKQCQAGLAILIGLTITGSSAAQRGFTLPTFDCKTTEKPDIYNWPGPSIETFGTRTPEIYFMCISDNAVTGDTVKAVWIADHIKGNEHNYETIAVKKYRVVKHPNNGETVAANLSLTKPPMGWVPGTYHIQLYINGIEDQTYLFTIR